MRFLRVAAGMAGAVGCGGLQARHGADTAVRSTKTEV